ncbi:hypothetical protein [Anaerosphaera multitolerans]|uniref:Uncharacterized protein n=1 Tax=Anaerosphaera multitolerans TaxID=2487351 RepID=A0A437S754_9FIRM|nr:hypothetical protein [Anaerosphaera multitolerans]RVU54863.1 hypothetical protein EF514_04560 [Anaerosphaera multitolerans]
MNGIKIIGRQEIVEVYKSIDGKLFEVFDEFQRYEINQCKISDLKDLVKPYLKSYYSNPESLLEDVLVGILENSISAINIIDRPF